MPAHCVCNLATFTRRILSDRKKTGNTIIISGTNGPLTNHCHFNLVYNNQWDKSQILYQQLIWCIFVSRTQCCSCRTYVWCKKVLTDHRTSIGYLQACAGRSFIVYVKNKVFLIANFKSFELNQHQSYFTYFT